MYFSKISNVGLEQFSDYVIHQKLFEIFTKSTTRKFIYVREDIAIYVYSLEKPGTSEFFPVVQTKEMNTKFDKDMLFEFKVKFNPVLRVYNKTTGKKQKRDLIEHSRIMLKEKGILKKDKDISKDILEDWFKKKESDFGFRIIQTNAVYNYQKEEFRSRKITFKSITFEGILKVTDTELFQKVLELGIGTSKGFGFGLIFIKHVK